MEPDKDVTISFSPPLYHQRYVKVLEVLSRFRPKKVVDFGCAECKFLQLALHEPYIEELYGVDICAELLLSSHHRLEPLTADFLVPRLQPLKVGLFQGSVHETDTRLSLTDAVVCIELIEHIYPANLHRFSRNIFGFVAPNLVVITTPNADFNALFNSKGRLRHWDHKFEWSRAMFKSWCKIICSKYGYSVDFIGIGEAPVGHRHLGYCSQGAVFVKKNCNRVPVCQNFFNYSLVWSVSYPFKTAFGKFAENLRSAIFTVTKEFIDLCQKEREKRTTGIVMITNMHHDRNNNKTPIRFFRKRIFSNVNDQFLNDHEMLLPSVYDAKRFNSYGHVRQPYANLSKTHFEKQYKQFSYCVGQFDCDTEDKTIPFNNLSAENHISCMAKIHILVGRHDFSLLLTDKGLQYKPRLVCFTKNQTSVPLSLFEKFFMFEYGMTDLLLLLQNQDVNGVSLTQDEKHVLVANDYFLDICEDRITDDETEYACDWSRSLNSTDFEKDDSESDWDND